MTKTTNPGGDERREMRPGAAFPPLLSPETSRCFLPDAMYNKVKETFRLKLGETGGVKRTCR